MQLNNQLSLVDQNIFDCLSLDNPKSFFLFAGAGSGKTRSLVEVLKKFKDQNSEKLRVYGQKVAIITYTNAACDEIKRRLDFDSTFVVSTIHSFAWELINSFQQDIKKWVKKNTEEEIQKLLEEQQKGRPGTKTAILRAKQIESKTNRLERLSNIKKFTYNPNGINDSKDSLNHAEVIKIASDFISSQPLMQSILIKKYPILLIDESQDTKKELIEAFFTLQSKNAESFTLGLFGDTMQRIYTDGKEDLGRNLPDNWLKPSKKINHRCPKRILKLINKIRSDVDTHVQEPKESNIEGIVRLFIINSNCNQNKTALEKAIAERMAELADDDEWKSPEKVKNLTLEHHMAASRGGFIDFFEPLYSIDKYKTGILDGSLSEVNFLTQQILPLIKAKMSKNEYQVAQIIKKYSPIIEPDKLKKAKEPIKELQKANQAVNALFSLWEQGDAPSLIDIVNKIKETELFNIPDSLNPVICALNEEIFEPDQDIENNEEIDEEENLKIKAWEKALNCPYSQLDKYNDYISENSQFGTHQGVKGLEFPRVMVILDDEEAKGFLFSYEKLFGAKEISQTDIKNQKEGKETSIDRTRRLFYVTCSRAEKSLAVVAYSNNPNAVKNYVLQQNWFSSDEIIEL